MKRLIYAVLCTVLALAVWTGVFVAGTLEGWWRPAIAPAGDTPGFLGAAIRTIDEQAKGNVALGLIADGQFAGTYFFSKGEPVDARTLFQVASLSKWITAVGVMSLVEDGRIELDAPVDTYLKRWHLPQSEYDNREVTVRRVLSHTAGLTDGLGYAGFAPGAPLQPLEESLTRAADASPGAAGAVRVGLKPGAQWEYSGGGYALLQLLIEDVTGEPFDAYMRREVMRPLGMERSTFVLPEDAENVAEFFDAAGGKATHFHFTATAAASLYTNVDDLARFIQAHLPGPNGEPPGRGVVSPGLLEEMRKPHAAQLGADIWGLGVVLYAPNGAGGHVVGHDGNNEPAINTAARFDPATGNGIVVLETGNRVLATRIAGDWVFWRIAKVDLLTLTMEARHILRTLAIGWGVILLAAVIVVWRRSRSRARPASARAQGAERAHPP